MKTDQEIQNELDDMEHRRLVRQNAAEKFHQAPKETETEEKEVEPLL